MSQGAETKKSWRDLVKVHPAADIFPMLPEDELRRLGEDIKANGLKEPVVLWSPGKENENQPNYLLDGRNRLDALELIGVDVVDGNGHIRLDQLPQSESTFSRPIHFHEFSESPQGAQPQARTDPYAYMISRNIRRRHLTKEQQADLILKVMQAGSTGRANLARSVKRNANGRLNGSTKDPLKEKVIEEASKHGISERTVKRSLAKVRGPAPPARRATEEEPPQKEKRSAAKPGDDKIEKAVSYMRQEAQRLLAEMKAEQRKLFVQKLTQFLLSLQVRR